MKDMEAIIEEVSSGDKVYNVIGIKMLCGSDYRLEYRFNEGRLEDISAEEAEKIWGEAYQKCHKYRNNKIS